MNTELEKIVGTKLVEKELTLAVAESCTGGLIGHRLTNVPGSSAYYLGSFTAYAYEAKARFLEVKWETLEAFGAVSNEVVAEMAVGVRKALESDIGISVSGIAGPTGGTPEKPVGLVYFGLSSKEGVWTRHYIFDGTRIEVKEQAADYALSLLLFYLEGKFDGQD